MGLDITDISRVTGIDVAYKIFESGRVVYLPQRLAVIGQGNTAKTYTLEKTQVTSAAEVAAKYGYGSPLHLAAKQLFPANGDGVGAIPTTIYPLDDDLSGVAADGDISASGTQTEDQIYEIKVNKIGTGKFQVAKDVTASAAITLFKNKIDAVLDMPVTTGTNTGVETSLDLTSKWKGESANDIIVEIEGIEAGITFTITQLTSGAVNPDVDDALALVGDVWETIFLNLLNYDDTDTLDKYQTFGVGRWSKLQKKPCFAICGTVDDLTTRTAVTDARKTDYMNVLIPAPGSKELPSSIAARAAARIAKKANSKPANGYYGILTGLEPGLTSEQEEYTDRVTSVNKGSSTTILVNGEIELNDTITMYHPDGELPPAYRYVVTLIKLMQVVFNVRLIFESEQWKGAPLLAPGEPTVQSDAKKPEDAKTVLGNLATNLGLQAIITDVAYTQENTEVTINSQNSNRIDPIYPVKVSGNTEVISVDLLFGFYFGS